MPFSPASPPQRGSRLIRVLSITILSLLAVIQLVSWYNNNFQTLTFCYRLTVEIEIASAVRTGASVIEVMAIRQPWPFPRSIVRLRGQAVAVGLGRHGMLLATLADGGSVATTRNIQAPFNPVPLAFGVESNEVADLIGHRRKLYPDGPMPALVWLPDPVNFKTMRLVPPDELRTVIAPEIRMRGMWIEITGDDVTKNLFTHLPWLAERIGRDRARGVLPLPAWSLSRGVNP